MKRKLEDLTRDIIYQTRDWTLWDWKRFRAKDNYWFVKDESVRQGKELQFKEWKLSKIIKHNNNN